MRATDVSRQNEFVTSTQAEAIENITGADIFGVDANTFKESKSTLGPVVKQKQLPTIATPVVAEQISQTPEHAAAISPESESFSWIENQWNSFTTKFNDFFARQGRADIERAQGFNKASEDVVEGTKAQIGASVSAVKKKLGPERELIDLNWKKMNSSLGFDQFTPEDRRRLTALRLSSRKNFGEQDYGLSGPWETLPPEVAASVADVGAVMWRNKEMIAKITGQFTVAGGALGSALPGYGTAAGASYGFTTGLSSGVLTASFYDSYKSTAASTYGELDVAKGEDGQPLRIDEKNKLYLAHGVGLVSGGITFAADKLMIKNIPFLRKFLTPRAVGELITNPANAGAREALISIGKTMASEGGEESLQEIVQILGEEIGSTYKDGEVAFTQGLMNAAEKIRTNKETQGRITRAGTVGALTGATIAAGGATADATVTAIRSEVTTPQEPTKPQSDIIQIGTPEEQAVQVLEFQDVVEASSMVFMNTNAAKQNKQFANGVRAKIVENTGIKRVWFLKDALSAFASTPEKAEAVRKMIDSSGTAAANLNAPIEMNMVQFLELQDQYPDIMEFAQLHPEGPSPRSAKVFAEKMAEQRQARAKIQFKLEIGEKSPDERANALKLGSDIDDETLIDTLGSSEVADAYIRRLDVEGVQFADDPTRMAQIAQMRTRIENLRDTLPDDKTAKQTLEQALNQKSPSNDVFGETDYLMQPIFTDVMRDVLPEGEVERFEAAQMEARKAVVEGVNAAAELEVSKVRDIYEEMHTEAQEQIEAERIANDPNVAVVDRFLASDGVFYPTERYTEGTDFRATHHKEGRLRFAIDPLLLTEDQQERYAKHPQLKKHKAFVRGGLHPDDAAKLLGANNGDTLLRILATTPSRQDIIDAAVERRRQQIKQNAKDSVDLDKTAMAEAYKKEAESHLNEIKYVLAKKWPAFKRQIIRAGTDIAGLGVALRRQARATVMQMKVGSLNPNQFKVGARKSQKLAMQAITKNDPLQYSSQKENVALNNELALATHIAIGHVNRVIKLARRLESPEMKQLFKDAGKIYEDARDELLDVYNLNPSKKDLAERGAYQKWVEQQIKEGNDNFEVPERLSDVRTSLQEMTVEEVVTVGNRLRSLLHQAKMKNELWYAYGDPAKQLQSHEALVHDITTQLQAHPDYNPKNAVAIQGDISAFDKIKGGMNDLLSWVESASHIIVDADHNKNGGLINDAVMAPLVGVGKNNEGGLAGKGRDWAAAAKQFDKIIEQFGVDEWQRLENTSVNVPEFQKSAKLNNGRLTKGNLFMMLLQMGNEGNQQRLVDGFQDVTFKTDLQTIKAVLERELDEKHAKAAQAVMDMYKVLYPRVQKLHEDMTGVTPDMVEAVPFVFKDRVYPGGYYPLMYTSEMSADKTARIFKEAKESADGTHKFNMRDTFYTDDMTRHGHTEKRTSNDQPVNLSMGSIGMGFEMVIHDLNFRKPIANALKIMTDKEVANEFAAAVGKSQYNAVVSAIVRTAGSIAMENNAVFDSSALATRLGARIRSGFSVGHLAYNLSSIAIQITSVPFAISKMGKNGMKHMNMTLKAMAVNPKAFGDFYKFAADINPRIKNSLEGIDENTRDPISKKLPVRNLHKSLSKIDAWRRKSIDWGFAGFTQVDNFQKVVVAMSAYRQFMDGDTDLADLETVQKMTPEERDHKAKVYANSIIETTLTAGSKLDRAKIQEANYWVSLFFNDARNSINNIMALGRQTRQGLQQGNYRQAATAATQLFVLTSLTRILTDLIRGNPTPFSESPDEWEDPLEPAKQMLAYLASSPYELLASNTPIARDIKFASDSKMFTTLPARVSNAPASMANDVMVALDVAYQYFFDNRDGVSPSERKSVGMTASYVAGGIPIKPLFVLYDALGNISEKETFTEPVGAEYRRKMDEMKKVNDELPAGDEKKLDDEAMNTLEEMTESLQARDSASLEVIPEGTFDVIKQIESGGNWWAKNPNSSAAGLYQFTKETWEDIMLRAPELGLTTGGRFAKNTEQQERAMEWFTKENARVLGRARIKPTIENLYAAHFLGAQKAVEVLNSAGDTKLKSLISREAMEANNFSGSMKVRDFKRWVTSKVNSVNQQVAVLDKPVTDQED